MTISTCDDQLQSRRKDQKNKNSSTKFCKYLSDGNGESDCVQRFHGDGLMIRIHSNHRMLEITGDGCWIVLSKNSGSVRVYGDGCRLHVIHNEGDIEYIGDGGRVLLGSESVKRKVKFVGDGGKVIFDSSLEAASKIKRKDSGKSSKERLNKEANYLEKDMCLCKKVINETVGCEKWDVNGRILSQEELDNAANNMKERNQAKYGKRRNEEARKSSRHQTVTKIITKIQTDARMGK